MIKKCLMCGKEFVPSKYNLQQKYCSKKCGSKKWYLDNIEQQHKKSSEWYQKNKESELKKNKEYRKMNKELFDWYHNKQRFNGMRQLILERDNYECVVCKSKTHLCIHHKDGSGRRDRTDINSNNDISNLITLCNSCHTKLHHYQKRENIILLQDEDIVRTIRELIEVDSKNLR